MTREDYFHKYALTVQQAANRLKEGGDVLAHKKPPAGEKYFPKIHRLSQAFYRNMRYGAVLTILEDHYISYAEG